MPDLGFLPVYLVLYGIEWIQCWFTLCSFSQVHLGRVEVQLGLKVCGGSFEYSSFRTSSTWPETERTGAQDGEVEHQVAMNLISSSGEHFRKLESALSPNVLIGLLLT